ncbi:hypothetical protein BG011_003422 [Mortierella polycephala]|uniref:DUF924-domain-containing protein n=1 Tax=Mortierella polycephala TaxID=41804 RepID=A0A9P6U3N9_9FUNG|nr:hypothetical protein BG011_003422 [Mortierella polycephala]
MKSAAALAAQTSKRLTDVWFKGYVPGEPLNFERFKSWYIGTKEFDDMLRNEFEQDVERALIDSEFRDNMKSTCEGTVALTILLDQIPRNIFRGSPRPFVEFDPLAREIVKEALLKQTCANVHPFFKHFLYMPLEHSENLEDQAESVREFTREYEQAEPMFKDMFKQYLTFAVKHEAVIKKFGRFPHRNAVLGRISTEAERIHLETGGDRW